MELTIRKVEYFYANIQDTPGAAYQFLSRLGEAGVNLLAFNAIPTGPENAQLVIFPDDPTLLHEAARAMSLSLDGPHVAFLVNGDDKLGAFADIHHQLFNGGVNVYASNGVTDGRGGYGYILWVRPDDCKKAEKVLGI